MNKFLFILTLVLITLGSCNRNNVKPEVYNDSLVVHQIRVVEKANKLQDAFDSYSEKEMLIRHKDLENQIENSIGAVKMMTPYNGDDKYKVAALEMLNGYKNLLNKEYKAAEKILEQPDSLYSDGDEARLEMLYKQIDMLSLKYNADFKKAQETFSNEYKITIKPEIKKAD